MKKKLKRNHVTLNIDDGMRTIALPLSCVWFSIQKINALKIKKKIAPGDFNASYPQHDAL
jgi:hypothetical protein